MLKRLLVCGLCVLLTGCRWASSGIGPAPAPPSAVKAAVCAVWIPFMEVETLLASGDPAVCRAALAACLDDCAARGVNTVYFHVRPNSDAYYDSTVFTPNPTTAALLAQGFDPLACAVELAHARGLTLHAWVNPYRIGSDPSRARTAAVFEHGGKMYYVPSDAAVQQLIVSGVRELVGGYDIDGVQFDDYFYPSGAVAADTPASFEQDAFTAYTQAGGGLSVGDWRRAQVSALIAACYAACHTEGGCVFGVSPGYDIEDDRNAMYADVAVWAQTAGYVDYLCPQLYFGFSHEYAPFETVLDRWDALPRDPSVMLIAGLAFYKTGLADDSYAGSGSAEWCTRDDIIASQLALVMARHWDGAALYSHSSFVSGADRDAVIVEKELATACNAWRNWTS